VLPRSKASDDGLITAHSRSRKHASIGQPLTSGAAQWQAG